MGVSSKRMARAGMQELDEVAVQTNGRRLVMRRVVLYGTLLLRESDTERLQRVSTWPERCPPLAGGGCACGYLVLAGWARVTALKGSDERFCAHKLNSLKYTLLLGPFSALLDAKNYSWLLRGAQDFGVS